MTMMLWILLVGCLSSGRSLPLSEEKPTLIVHNAPPERSQGSGCGRTCSLADAPDHAPTMDEATFVALLERWSNQPLGASTLELDTLLFDADLTRGYLSTHRHRLSPKRLAFLEKELARDEVHVETRLVEEGGEVRGPLRATPFPL